MNLKFLKNLAKGLCLDTEKRFFGTGRTGIEPRMMIFRNEVFFFFCFFVFLISTDATRWRFFFFLFFDIDRCYPMEMLKRSKKVTKELSSPIEKRFFGPGRARIGPGMLIFQNEVHMDRCYLLMVLKRSQTVAKGLF